MLKNVIESTTYSPNIEGEDKNLKLENGKIIFNVNKPDNFTRMIKCENGNGQRLSYVVKDDLIKVVNNSCSPFTLYYEVSKSNILENLMHYICKK